MADNPEQKKEAQEESKKDSTPEVTPETEEKIEDKIGELPEEDKPKKKEPDKNEEMKRLKEENERLRENQEKLTPLAKKAKARDIAERALEKYPQAKHSRKAMERIGELMESNAPDSQIESRIFTTAKIADEVLSEQKTPESKDKEEAETWGPPNTGGTATEPTVLTGDEFLKLPKEKRKEAAENMPFRGNVEAESTDWK